MTRFPVFLAALIFCLAAPLSTYAEGTATTVQTEGAIQLDDSAERDAQIEERVTRLLNELDGFDKVIVSVSEGVVTVSGEVLDNARQDELNAILNRVEGVIAIENATTVSASLEERLSPAIERLSDRIANLIANAPIFLVALTVFLLIAVFGWFITARIGLWERLAPNSFIADVYRTVARIAFVILGIVIALDILNATALIGAVLGAAGVVGLAVGFAVRDTVENFIASILLSLRQPFRPNDFVDIQGDQGTVARLTSRATILISPDGNHVRIPNATVFKGRIVNFTRDPQRRFTFDLGVDADSDLPAALATATEAIRALPFVLDEPEISAWIKDVGDSNVVLTFTGWVDQTKTNFPKARGEAIRAAKTALETSGFGLPEPIYRLRLDGAGQVAPTEPVKPIRPPAQSELPDASDPTHTDDAASEAAERERAAEDAQNDLLAEERMAE